MSATLQNGYEANLKGEKVFRRSPGWVGRMAFPWIIAGMGVVIGWAASPK